MAGPGPPSDVREFTRHASDVLTNLNELRKREILTDVTLRVRGRPLQAHKAVLTACSGFFYSAFHGGHGDHEVRVLSLPSSIEPVGFQALLDFMYTSRLLLSPGTAPAVLVAASYLQMEHVVESCRRFLQASYDRVTFFLPPLDPQMSRMLEDRLPPPRGSAPVPFPRGPAPDGTPTPASFHPAEKDSGPAGSPGTGDPFPAGPPAPPAESSGCPPNPDPKISHWKKHRFIALSSMLHRRQSGPPGDGGRPLPRRPLATPPSSICKPAPSALPSQPPEDPPMERGGGCSPGEKPYHCSICGAQFNRPANLKTHLRIHSGEKPYKCDMCGSCFVQVAHLRAHILIHTGEKPYPCGTCGTRFRHLQTLKSHLRIHTGEKPYHCEECGVRFRHKSQLRLHLRQKHGAVTNTKIRYQVLDGPYATVG